MENESIFIAIASFKDEELVSTIFNCIEKSDNPENLVFGICHQYDNSIKRTSENCLDFIQNKFNIKVIKFPFKESKGGCWARQLAQTLYNKEKYHLQVDSHTRFIGGWDTYLKSLINNLQNYFEKPIISFLPPSYYRNSNLQIDYEYLYLDNLNYINIPKPKNMSHDYWIDMMGYTNQQNIKEPTQVPYLYGGFIFSYGNWVETVEQDPLHYYTGEELALSIRSFTHGYDIIIPDKIVAWHRGNSPSDLKHFRTISTGEKEHKLAMVRLKMLIEGGDLGKYGLGSRRTLEDFENFAGVNFKDRKINL